MTLPTRYDFKVSEPIIEKLWNDNEISKAVVDTNKKPYAIVMPPPNITGSLHWGHALNNVLQDVLIRFKRMQGYSTLYQPGTDHAGIATQFVVEKEIAKQKQTRFKLGREEFLKKVWEWKGTYEEKIISQLKKLGIACDWSRLRFTMDKQYSKAVLTAFAQLYSKQLIYKGKYLVNWCPRCKTALSDLEAAKKTEKGKLYFIRYRLKDENNKYIEVATTRPETMLGDTACAVNPSDKRFSHLVGKSVVVPLVERNIPIIGDSFVLTEFGTGIVKITPAHDFNDYECGKRHNLPQISILDESAVVNENGQKYKGLDRFEARKQIIEELEKRGLLIKTEDYDISITKCSRCEQILEPYLSTQWFLKMDTLAKQCLNEIESGNVKFSPPGFEKIAIQWMEEIRDWCISRQLWWGHRIPIYECAKCNYSGCHIDNPPSVCPNCNNEIKQVEDVLDTWFSSSLWPFATLGWPDRTAELDYFYPTAVLITARDIINLWVSRMIFMGLEFMGANPFKDVYIHSTVLTLEGQRHSKSKGVGMDPVEVIDEYGADSLRFTLCKKTTGLQDLRIDKPPKDNSILEARNFITKLYNASRFIMGKADTGAQFDLNIVLSNYSSIEDRWIVSAVNRLKKTVAESLNQYRFGDYAKSVYEFTWDNLCDYYIELSKNNSNQNTGRILCYVLADLIKILAPAIPFVCEELWQELGKICRLDSKLLVNAQFPVSNSDLINDSDESKFYSIISCVKAVRATRSRFNIPPKEPLDIVITKDIGISDAGRILRSLANVNSIQIIEQYDRPNTICEIVEGYKLYILLEGKINTAAEKERLLKQKTELESRISNLRKRFSDQSFMQRAPTEVIDQSKSDLESLENQLTEVSILITKF